jgi:tRNA-modifying protein YgfZ
MLLVWAMAVMNSSWHDFLRAQGAAIERAVNERARVAHFGRPEEELHAAKNANVLCDLSHWGVIRFSGSDAQNFLQGQFTNDVRKLNPSTSQYGAYCTPKGRMLASFLLCRSADSYLMQLPSALREPIQKRLAGYVLRSKVAICDASEESVRLGLAGAGAPGLVHRVFGSVPQAANDLIEHDLGLVARLAADRFEILAAPQAAPALWQALSEVATPAGAACWDWLVIHAGVPVITPATQEQFIPQAVNFDLIGGLNFQKGCYPGQEIIARTHYLGKLKRRMFLAHIASGTAPQPGDEVYAADTSDQAVGTIVNSAPAPDGGYDVLAAVLIESVQAGQVRWKAGPPFKFMPLPYALPES